MNDTKKDPGVYIARSVAKDEAYTNIPKRRRNFIVFLVALVAALGPLAGNIYIPLIPQLSRDFNVSESVISLTVSVFMIVFAFAPIFWATTSDYGGRKFLIVVALIIFVISNILIATLPSNIVVLFIFRVFQAVGSSTLSVGMGVLVDVCEPKIRGRAVSYFLLGPQLGPVIGPVLSIIGSKVSWRWTFGFLAILGATDFVLILFFLPETLRFLVGRGEYLENSKNWFVTPKFRQKKLVDDFPRPPKPNIKNYAKLIKKPTVWICSLCGALVFASFYGVTVTLGGVLQKKYRFEPWRTSISYLCPGFGLIIGSLSSGHLSDFLRKRKKTNTSPENRFLLQIVGIVFLIAGLVGYGWLIQFNVHVSSILIFAFLCAFSNTWVLTINTIYLSECSIEQPATYISIGNMARNIGATISSAIIHPLTKSMGYGWCFTGLGFVSAFCGFLTMYIVIVGKEHERNRKNGCSGGFR